MLVLRRDQEIFMHNHVEACLPEEGCGLIGGINGQAELVVAVTNAEHSATRFYMDERELVSALLAIEEAHFELVAIFHSHPNGPPEPSKTDVQSSPNHPGVLSVILIKDGGEWQTRAFDVNGEGFQPVNIKITDHYAY